MKFYHIWRNDRIDYDENVEMIIRADSETAARCLAAGASGQESYETWLDSYNSSIVELVIHPDDKESIVVASFQAG